MSGDLGQDILDLAKFYARNFGLIFVPFVHEW